jgi:hypothetical protein
MSSRFRCVVRFFSLVAAGFPICISSQPSKVANIGAGQRYDESIPAGHHVLAVNYTPRTQHQPTSMRLTVHPGETYGFNAIRDSIQGVSFRQSNRIPP